MGSPRIRHSVHHNNGGVFDAVVNGIGDDDVGLYYISIPAISMPPNLTSPEDRLALDFIGPQSIQEQELLEFTAHASHPSYPNSRMIFSLDAGAPEGAKISLEGVFDWTPTYDQGNQTYAITVRVQIEGLPMQTAETIDVTVIDVAAASVIDPNEDDSIAVHPRGFNNIEMVRDSQGKRYVVYEKKTEGTWAYLQMATAEPGSDEWHTRPLDGGHVENHGDKFALAIDSHDQLHLLFVWNQGIAYKTYDGEEWSRRVLISGNWLPGAAPAAHYLTSPSLSIDGSNTLHVAYAVDTGRHGVFYTRKGAFSDWSQPLDLTDSLDRFYGRHSSDVSLAVGADGIPSVVWLSKNFVHGRPPTSILVCKNISRPRSGS